MRFAALLLALCLVLSGCSSQSDLPSDGAGGGLGLAAGGAFAGSAGGSPGETGGWPGSGGSSPTSSGAMTGAGGTTAQDPTGGAGNGSGAEASSSGGSSAGGAPGSGGDSTSGGANGSGGGKSGPYAFMALGDSITGTTCYTQYLAEAFNAVESPGLTFVGSVTNNQVCSGAGNTKSEGHGGYLVTYLRTNSPPQSGKGSLAELEAWAQATPDIVLIHFGTNDVWNNIAAAQILEAERFVIEEFRKQNPNILFFISKIIPMNPNGCGECSGRVAELNAALTEGWAQGISTSSSRVLIIDQWTGFDAQADTGDGVHPNPSGGKKMAGVAFDAIMGVLSE